MELTRRALLASPAALARPPLATPPSGDPVLDAAPDGRMRLHRPGLQDGLILPAGRARLLACVSLSGHRLAMASFAADPDDDTTIDLLAVTHADGAGVPRLIGLELLGYADGRGTRLTTRLAATGDGARLVLARLLSVTRSPTLIARSAWRDYLAWEDDAPNDTAPLADAPVHPPPDGSVAAQLALRRGRVRVALAGATAAITPELLSDTWLARPLRP